MFNYIMHVMHHWLYSVNKNVCSTNVFNNNNNGHTETDVFIIKYISVCIYAYMYVLWEWIWMPQEWVDTLFNGIFMFWQENTFITWFLMMSLCYITYDIIDPFLETINKCMLDSEVHNTARSQWVYIDLVMECVLTLR